MTRRDLKYWLRLLRFTVFVLVAFPACAFVLLPLYLAFVYAAPVPSIVNRPADLGFPVEDVEFIGGDDLTLRAWYTPPRGDALIILLHGYFSNRLQLRFQAEVLASAGYGLLMVDERASGESDGTQRALGWPDVADIRGALDFLNSRRCDASTTTGCVRWVGIAGCSIGGQIALRAAAQYPDIQAVLADGPSMVSAADFPPPDTWFAALMTPHQWLIDRFLELRTGLSAPPTIMETIHTIAPRPILLIAGSTVDPIFSGEVVRIRQYQQAAGSNAQLWEVPGGRHCDGPAVAPAEYARRMLDFFDAASR
ncbi:MAG: alpha/beta fold hydrolase [Anaerolineae bacterium]|nr:alpha/beta fold hydrolase [Anaerolineae bacterium]